MEEEDEDEEKGEERELKKLAYKAVWCWKTQNEYLGNIDIVTCTPWNGRYLVMCRPYNWAYPFPQWWLRN
jgi:hypothetical protein